MLNNNLNFLNTINNNANLKFLFTNSYARMGIVFLICFIFISIFFFNKEKKYEDGIAFTNEQVEMILNWIPEATNITDLKLINNVVSDLWNNRKVFSYNKDISFQEPATPIAEGIINFHHDLMFYLFIILFFVVFMLFRCIFLFAKNKVKQIYVVTHAPILEIIWTIIPAIILVIIAIPSFALLYSMDEIVDPAFTVKVIGHQWYWTYELTDPDVKNFLFKLQQQYNGFSQVVSEFPYQITTDFKDYDIYEEHINIYNYSNAENDLHQLINYHAEVFDVTAKHIASKIKDNINNVSNISWADNFNTNGDNFQEITTSITKEFQPIILQKVENIERIFKGKLRFDSYLVPFEDNTDFARRHEYLLKVDNPLHVPIHLVVRVLVTSADVLHAWAVPSLGVKIDACPGRLNETSFFLNYASIFYGQCSEICGVNHGFMPIIVHGHDFWEGREIPEELIDQYVLLYLYLYKYMKVQKELGII